MAEYATPESIRGEEFRDFTAPITGRVYRLRRVWPVDLVRDGVLSIPQADQFNELKGKVESGEPLDEFDRAQVSLFQTAILCRGLAAPRVVDKPIGEAPAGFLSVDEFPRADFDPVFLAICMFSGLGEGAAAAQESAVSMEPREGESFRADGGAQVHAGAADEERAVD